MAPTTAEPFVRMPQKRLPEVAAVSGSNYVESASRSRYHRQRRSPARPACFAVTDNLIKGGAGQGIQSMNLIWASTSG